MFVRSKPEFGEYYDVGTEVVPDGDIRDDRDTIPAAEASRVRRHDTYAKWRRSGLGPS
jgi:hypothetical protein